MMSYNNDSSRPVLFTPMKLRGVLLKNRVVISPMQQYSADKQGLPTDYHIAHYGRLAMGGAGLVFTEALCTSLEGRLTYSDLGIWDDSHVAGLARIAKNIKSLGAIAGAQILHAGRKASVQRPWEGYQPLSDLDLHSRGEAPWQTLGPSPTPANPGWPIPREMTKSEIDEVVIEHAKAARRCRQAGFEVLGVHAAHGYLIHSFLSPISNLRSDHYGGDLNKRMRFALEIAEAVRSEWPHQKPLFFRLSCIDDELNGWTINDSIILVGELKKLGVDVIDCSSRGLGQRGTPVIEPRRQGFQVPFSNDIRKSTKLATMAVGLIMEPQYAEKVLQMGQADLIAIGREALNNPNWPLQAAVNLVGEEAFESIWPAHYGWWLSRRAKSLAAAKTTP